MATAPFAALEARLVAAEVRHLANAVGVLDGVSVAGIFESEYMQAFDGMAGSATTYRLASTSAASATTASVLVVGAASYRVRSVQPDGTGITVLLLERQ